MKIEDHPAFADKLPRICYVLGGEKTPLKIGEVFQLSGMCEGCHYFVTSEGVLKIRFTDGSLDVASDSLSYAINHSEKIIRRQQFSEDEKALMRLYVGAGYHWIARESDKEVIAAYCEKPDYDESDEVFESSGEFICFPDKFLPGITFENSPFDAAAYLESEAAK